MEKKLIKFAAVILTFLFSKVTIAQNFTETSSNLIPAGASSSSGHSDIDNDGDLDFIMFGSANDVNLTPTTTLYINDNGTLTVVSDTPFEGLRDGELAFADIDNDGDEDLLISGADFNFDGFTALYTNEAGVFTEVSNTPFAQFSTSSLAFSDIDNDGDQDVIINGLEEGTFDIKTVLYSNNGSGTFTETQTFDIGWDGSATFSDIDNDGDEDLLLTGRDPSDSFPSTKLYINNSGTFKEVTGIPFEDVMFSSVAFSDIDNDGDEDLLMTGQNSSFEGSTKLYTNNLGVFTEISHPFTNIHFGAVAFTDVEDDGDYDVILTGFDNGFSSITEFFINDGTGIYTIASSEPFVGLGVSTVSFFDINGDNAEDLIIGGNDNADNIISNLYINNNNNNALSVEGFGINDSFSIYPNPVKDIINITINNTEQTSLNYIITNMIGQKVMKGSLENNLQDHIINIASLAKGTYILSLQSNTGFFSRKLVIE